MSKIKPIDIAVIGVLSAIIFALQVLFAALPNIEPVSLLIILFTLHYRKKTLFIIYIFALFEGLMYGFTSWWFTYLYVWTVLYFIVTLVQRLSRSPIFFAVISAIFGLFFGFLCSLTYFVIGGVSYGFAYFISGIPFDIMHCIGNFFVCLILFKPLDTMFTKVNKSLHLTEDN